MAWFLPFLALAAAAGYVSLYAVENGNLQHFKGFKDLSGQFCLPSTDTQYIYFCMDRAGDLNVSHAVCVAYCPNDTLAEHNPQCGHKEGFGGIPGSVILPGIPGSAPRSSYTTKPHFDMMCAPVDTGLRTQVAGYLVQARHNFVKHLVLSHFDAAVLCVVVTVIVSYIYLNFLWYCASMLVWIGLALTASILTILGIYLLGWMKSVGLAPRSWVSDANFDANPMIGMVFLVLGISLACCSMRMSSSINQAMECLEEAVDCVMDTPSLKLQPLVHVVLQILTILPIVACIVLLLSCQDVSFAYGQHGTTAHFLLLTRTQCIYLGVLVCLFIWMQQINIALSAFVLAYITQIWFYNGGAEGDGYVPASTLCRAYCVCLRYHFGTVIKGAFLHGLTWPVRELLGFIVGLAEMRLNVVSACVSTGCCFCIAAYDRYLEPLSPDTFIEVALNARPFMPSARAHLHIVDAEEGAKRILHGAGRVFQLVGFALISMTGAVCVCLIRLFDGGFYLQGDSRQVYYARCVFLCLGFTISAVVAAPFMTLFRVVADTMLYNRTVEELRAIKAQQWTWGSTWCCARGKYDAFELGDLEDDAYSTPRAEHSRHR